MDGSISRLPHVCPAGHTLVVTILLSFTCLLLVQSSVQDPNILSAKRILGLVNEYIDKETNFIGMHSSINPQEVSLPLATISYAQTFDGSM